MMYHRPLTGRDDVRVTAHFRAQMSAKGFDMGDVARALLDPYKVTEVRRYPGQVRFCGAGLAVVVAVEAGFFNLITVYLDGVVTPMREDQRTDGAALASQRLARV